MPDITTSSSYSAEESILACEEIKSFIQELFTSALCCALCFAIVWEKMGF